MTDCGLRLLQEIAQSVDVHLALLSECQQHLQALLIGEHFEDFFF